jgi:hypothetical protein
MIPDFVAGLMRIGVVLRQDAEEKKRRELAEQKRARELEKLRKDIEEEEKKLKQFDEWLVSWERAEQMRRFIALYAAKSESWPAEKQSKYREWIEWASREADSAGSVCVGKALFCRGSKARTPTPVVEQRS